MAIADRANTGSETLDEIINKSDEAFKSLHEGFLHLTGSNSDTELKHKIEDAFKSSGETLMQQLKNFKEAVSSLY